MSEDTNEMSDEQAEPWSEWESNLCVYTLVLGIGCLLLLSLVSSIFRGM